MLRPFLVVLTLVPVLSFAQSTGRHILGLAFDLPAGWTIAKREGAAIQFKVAGQGEHEVYVLQVEPTKVTTLLDEATLNEFRQLVGDGWEIIRDEKRKNPLGEAANVVLRKKGDGGSALMAMQWTIHKGLRILVMGAGTEAGVAKRSAEAQKLFDSVRLAPRELTAAEQTLLKAWNDRLRGATLVKSNTTTSSGGAGFGSMSSHTVYRLGADGRYRYEYKSSSSIDVGGLSGGGTSEDSDTGRWQVLVLGDQVCGRVDSDKGVSTIVTLRMSGRFVMVDDVPYTIER